jgi:hypothetical protein
LRGRATGFDGFGLALAFAQSEDEALARQFYDRAEQWFQKRRSRSADLLALRADAAQALQIDTADTDPLDDPQSPSLPEEPEP